LRIGLSTGAWYGTLETEDAAFALRAYGVPCCEVFLNTYSEYGAAFGELVRERLGPVAAVSIHTKTQHFETDIIGQSARQRQDAFDLLARALDAGAALGASIYVYHGLPCVRGSRPAIAPWAASLQRAQAMAAQRGMTFCWETVSWCCINAPDRIPEALAACPDMHFVLDVKQSLEAGFDPLRFVEVMGARLRHVHVLDFDESGRWALPGRGSYDFETLAAALRALGYAGDVILEPYGHMVRDECELKRSLQYLRDVFETKSKE